MTILNNPSDGLHTELIVLFRTIAYFKSIPYDDLLNICLPKIMGGNDDEAIRVRLRGALNNWIKLGLFEHNGDNVELITRFKKIKKSDIDSYTNELPQHALEFVCLINNAQLILEDPPNQGLSGDFIRAASWLLAQDIYSLPDRWDDVENLSTKQSIKPIKIIQNDSRWGSLRFWMRYFGLATGDSSSFQIDPTIAIKTQLKYIFSTNKELPAKEFLMVLSKKLPILDFGEYRVEVEKNLKLTEWRKQNTNELSQSLSFALRRLDLKGTIQLRGKSDTGSSYRLTGRDYRHWSGFESVVWDQKL